MHRPRQLFLALLPGGGPALRPCCLAASPVRRGPRPRSFTRFGPPGDSVLQAIRNDRYQQPPAAVTSNRRVAPAGPLGPARTDEPTGARGPARWRAPMISSTGEIGLPAGRPRRRAPASGGGPAATTSRRITAPLATVCRPGPRLCG